MQWIYCSAVDVLWCGVLVCDACMGMRLVYLGAMHVLGCSVYIAVRWMYCGVVCVCVKDEAHRGRQTTAWGFGVKGKNNAVHT